MTINPKFETKTYPSIKYTIGLEKVKEFCKATMADSSKFTEIAPPTFPVVYSSALLENVLFDKELNLNLKKLVHGEQEFVYHQAAKIGDTITSTSHINRIFSKKSHDFVVFKTISSNQDMKKICDATSTFVIRGGNDKDFSLQEKLAIKFKALSDKLQKSKTVIDTPKPVEFSTEAERYVMKAYIDKYLPHKYAGASGDFNAIHLDHELGLNAGLGGNILHGMCTMSIGASFALHARPEVKEFKYFKARFSGMVQPGDTLSYEGSFKEDQKIFCFDCKNQSGAKVLEQAEVRY